MMKNDRYIKALLTIIAVCLVILVVDKIKIIPQLQADPYPTTDYALVPVNDDGSINVRISGTEEIMEVNIHQVGGELVHKALPVEPENSVMDINITEVGGWRVNNRVPVEN